MLKFKNLSLLIVFSALCLGFAHKAHANEVKIAFVDLRKALNETNEGQRAMKKLQRDKDALQRQIDKKEKSIMSMQEKIKEQQNILSQEALQKRAQEYYQAVQELQQDYAQFQQELAHKEMKATQDILVKLEALVAEIGSNGNYTMIYDRSSGAVVWGPSHLDLTDRLIKSYNSRHK